MKVKLTLTVEIALTGAKRNPENLELDILQEVKKLTGTNVENMYIDDYIFDVVGLKKKGKNVAILTVNKI